jgi:hypothetical protein
MGTFGREQRFGHFAPIPIHHVWFIEFDFEKE